MDTRKENAIHFLYLTSSGRAREAFNSYVGTAFKHHNVYFKGDKETLIVAMEEAARQYPEKVFEVQRAIHEGDLVAVHSRFRLNPTDTEYAVMHIFRFENGKVAELWDFGQPAPQEQINEHGMF